MLYLTIKKDYPIQDEKITWVGATKTIAWEIGDSSSIILSQINEVEAIMASGEELKLIKDTFYCQIGRVYSIPMPMPIERTDIIWFGDIAKNNYL